MPSAQEFLEALGAGYAAYYDLLEFDRSIPYLAAAFAFHSTSESYVLSKKIKLWAAETHDYSYVFSVDELTADIFKECRNNAHTLGMRCIRPHSEHMTSHITAIFLCQTCTEEAAQELRKTKIHKNFLFSLHGWMDFCTAAVILPVGDVLVNKAAGKDLQTFLKKVWGRTNASKSA